ncbi:MAG: twin-arginine translocation signal domain-containing protein [Faecalibacterium prausnitzii]
MSEMFSRRVFLRGLGVVAAAAALTACSSTNEAVNQALIEGAVGGIVATDCKIGSTSRYRAANATVPIYDISFKIVMTNVSSKPVTLSGDNFRHYVLDGTPIPQFNFSARDVGDSDIWRTYDSLTIRPGEERTSVAEVIAHQPMKS